MVGQQKKGLAMQTAADRPKHRPRFSDSRIWDVMYSTPFLGGSQLVGFAERRIEAGAPKPYGMASYVLMSFCFPASLTMDLCWI